MEKYEINDVSDRRLEAAYWLLERRELFKRIGMRIFIGFNILLWLFIFFNIFIYIRDLNQDRQILLGLAQNQVDLEKFFAEHKPQPLIISGAQILNNGKGVYDFVATASNLNLNRGMQVLRYRFVAGDFVTPVNEISLAPGQKVYLLSLANKITTNLTSSPMLEIVSSSWENWREPKQNVVIPVVVSDLSFTNNGSWGSSVNFKAVNNSLQNIWEVGFQAVVSDGARILAVNQITTTEFKTGETRNLEINFFTSLPQSVRVDVVPLVNIYDSGNFYDIPAPVLKEL